MTIARMMIGCLTLLGIGLAMGTLGGLRHLRRADIGRLFAIGFCGNVLSPYLVTVGLTELPAGVGSLLANSSPLVVAIAAPLTLGERIGRWAVVGLVAGLAGVGVLLLPGAGPGTAEAISSRGVVVTLLGAVAWSAYIILGRRLMGQFHPIAITLVAASFGLPILVLFTLLDGSPTPRLEQWIAVIPSLLWLGVFSTGLGFAAWMLALRRIRAASLSAFQYFVPVFAVIFAYPLLGEIPTLTFLAGGMLVLLGVAAAQRR